MIIQELDFFEIFLKYGKTKGWLHPAPSYNIKHPAKKAGCFIFIVLPGLTKGRSAWT